MSQHTDRPYMSAPIVPQVLDQKRFTVNHRTASVGARVLLIGFLAGVFGLLPRASATTPTPPAPNPITPLPTLAPGDANHAWTPRIEQFDGVAMAYVPAGCFSMGSEEREDEQPIHEVCSEAFWIDITEVTQADFERIGGTKARANRFDGDRRPVESITWFEAHDFCVLRGARLPTEAEWEYAARGPQSWNYPWGDEFIADNVVYAENSGDESAEVGSRPSGASWVGAVDMSGNVWEWVSTIYAIGDGDFAFSEPGERVYAYPYSATDGRERAGSDSQFFRGMRGGSWLVDVAGDTVLRSAMRGWMRPYYSFGFAGFRCVRSD